MLLGLDLGTTNVKAVVTEADGRIVASASAPVSIDHRPDGGVEQSIDEITSAALSAMGEAADGCEEAEIRAVGVSSQGGALLIQTEGGEPAGPVISWLDSRGGPYDETITAELGADWFAEHTGHGRSGLAIGQMLRLREEGGLPDRCRIGFVGDVVVSRLCGRAAHDRTNLSLAMLYNPSLDGPDPDLLDRLGLSEERLPDLLPATATAGPLLAEVSLATGLPAGIPVAPAVHDQYAAALGCGAVRAGDVMFGAGTAWVLLALSDTLAPPAIRDAYVCRHPAEGVYGQLVALGTGGSAVSWALRMLGLGEDADVDDIISRAPAGCDGLRCVPLFSNAGRSAGPGGRLAGMRLSHGPAHVLRAVVEGLACELATYLRLLEVAGVGASRLLMCGRAAQGDTVPQIISDVTALPVDCLEAADVSALGAAVVARCLLEPRTPVAEISRSMVPPSRSVVPGPGRALYADVLQDYLRAA